MITETSLSGPDATLVIELVSFLIVVAVTAKFVLPRLRTTIDERQSRISTALAAADAADRHRETVEAECRDLLTAARRQARAITDGARATKEHLIAEGRREGHSEYTWRASRIDRDRRRNDDEIRRRLVREATQVLLTAIREVSVDDADAARLATVVGRAMTTLEGEELVAHTTRRSD